MTPKTDISLGLYARQTAFAPTPSSPKLLDYAEHGLCQRRNNRSAETLHHNSRIVLPSLTPLNAYYRQNTLLNCHEREREEGEVVIINSDDVLSGNEKNDNEANTSLPIRTSSSADISVLGIPLRSIILLNLVAIIWGTQHSVIKSVVDDSVISGNGFGFTSWAEHVFGARWEQLLSAMRYSSISTNDSGGGSAGTAAYFTLARFSIAAVLAARYTPGLNQRPIDDDQGDINVQPQSTLLEEIDSNNKKGTNLAWKYGIELGLYMFLGYGFQAIGLQTTTASRSGFLLYLNVKLVPFFSFLIFGKKIQTSTWISALVAFAGTALLALDNASDVTNNGLDASFTVGDLWSIAAAAASALFILRMETASKAVAKSAELNAANLWTVTCLSLVWTVWVSFNSLADDASTITPTLPDMLVQTLQYTFQQTANTITSNPLQLIYLSAVTTALANYIQSIAQKEVSAERASIFYALDPVYGAAFANLLLGETLGFWGWVGASLIAVAAATNAVFDFSTTDVGYDSNDANTNKNV